MLSVGVGLKLNVVWFIRLNEGSGGEAHSVGTCGRSQNDWFRERTDEVMLARSVDGVNTEGLRDRVVSMDALSEVRGEYFERAPCVFCERVEDSVVSISLSSDSSSASA